MYELELYSLTASVLPDPVGFLQVFLLKYFPKDFYPKTGTESIEYFRYAGLCF